MVKIALIITLFFSVFGCKAQSKVTNLNPSQSLIKRAIKEAIDERIALGINQSIIIGVIDSSGVDIYARGKISHKSDSTPDERTLFEIGSITKIFTGLLLAAKVVEGQVSLTDHINPFLPDSLKLPSEVRSITLKNLSTHTSGLGRNPSNLHSDEYNPTNPYAHYSAEYLMQELTNSKLISEPGKESHYSNSGVGLLGYLLSQQEGLSYYESIKKHILMPLNMNRTSKVMEGENVATGYTFAVPVESWNFDATAGAGILKSTVDDMLLFLSAQLGFAETTLKDAIQLSHQSHFKVEEGKAIGLGWGIYDLANGDRLYRHNGGTAGFRSFIGFLEKSKQGVIIFTNSSNVGVDDLGLHQLDSSFELSANFKPSVGTEVSSLIEKKGLVAAKDELNSLDSASLNTNWGELNLLGYTYLKQQQNDKAIEVFALNNKLHPNNADGHDSLGEAYFEGRQWDKSLQSYQRALDIDPDYENAKKMIERIKQQMSERE